VRMFICMCIYDKSGSLSRLPFVFDDNCSFYVL